MHRYVSHSASPNEITYLKSLGLIPRKGGNKFKSDKHMPKLAKDLSRATSERRTSPREAAIAGGITGGVLGSFASYGIEGIPTKQLLFRRAAPLAALTAAGYAGAQALINKGKDAKTPAKRNAYTAAGQLAGIVAALAPTAIPIGLALRAHKANQLRRIVMPPGKGQVIKFPKGKGTQMKNRAKSKLGLSPRKKGELIPFDRMNRLPPGPFNKLSHVFGSMMDELEKISATDAGFTLKGGRPIKSNEFTVMVQGRSPVTGKPVKFKQNVGGHGRSITVSDEIPAAPAPTSASTNLQSPKAAGDEK